MKMVKIPIYVNGYEWCIEIVDDDDVLGEAETDIVNGTIRVSSAVTGDQNSLTDILRHELAHCWLQTTRYADMIADAVSNGEHVNVEELICSFVGGFSEAIVNDAWNYADAITEEVSNHGVSG